MSNWVSSAGFSDAEVNIFFFFLIIWLKLQGYLFLIVNFLFQYPNKSTFSSAILDISVDANSCFVAVASNTWLKEYMEEKRCHSKKLSWSSVA